jgi:hypothetical protein
MFILAASKASPSLNLMPKSPPFVERMEQRSPPATSMTSLVAVWKSSILGKDSKSVHASYLA